MEENRLRLIANSNQTDIQGRINLEQVKKLTDEAVEKAVVHAKVLIEQQSQYDRSQFISIFGIFASVLAFLVINFQFLNTLRNINQIIGYSFILAGLLVGLNVALYDLVNDKLNMTKLIRLYVIVGLLIMAGLFFTVMGNLIINNDARSQLSCKCKII